MVDFPPIRRQVWVKFCSHGSVDGAGLVPSGFVGLGLVSLNPDPVPVVPGPKLNTHATSNSL
jgi:hypothetical protein